MMRFLGKETIRDASKLQINGASQYEVRVANETVFNTIVENWKSYRTFSVAPRITKQTTRLRSDFMKKNTQMSAMTRDLLLTPGHRLQSDTALEPTDASLCHSRGRFVAQGARTSDRLQS